MCILLTFRINVIIYFGELILQKIWRGGQITARAACWALITTYLLHQPSHDKRGKSVDAQSVMSINKPSLTLLTITRQRIWYDQWTEWHITQEHTRSGVSFISRCTATLWIMAVIKKKSSMFLLWTSLGNACPLQISLPFGWLLICILYAACCPWSAAAPPDGPPPPPHR